MHNNKIEEIKCKDQRIFGNSREKHDNGKCLMCSYCCKTNHLAKAYRHENQRNIVEEISSDSDYEMLMHMHDINAVQSSKNKWCTKAQINTKPKTRQQCTIKQD